MRRGALLSIIVAISGRALADTTIEIPLQGDAEARISVSSCFSVLPFCGYAPITVKVRNDSVRPQRWTFQFDSPAFTYVATDSMSSSASVDVSSQSTRSFKMVVPLASRETGAYMSQLNVVASGNRSGGNATQQFPAMRRSGKGISAFVALSDALATKSLGQLEKALSGRGMDLAAARFDPLNLSDDWRTCAGVTALWITNQELDSLSPLQREALHDWVLQGGSFFVVGGGDPGAQFRSTGFGTVTLLPEQTLDVEGTADTIRDLGKLSIEHQLNESYGEDWKAVAQVGSIHLNVPLLITFISLFAILVGPINLFVFAPPGRRHRLFWTTPLISIGASIFLLVIIGFQDGFGGVGSRFALIYVDPIARRNVVLQEQIARTGVLLGSSFQTRDPCFIAPIVLGTPPTHSKKKYKNFGNEYRGEWFVSRFLQPHWIESVAPSRTGVSLLNAAAVRDSQAAPEVVSNIDGVLEELWFRDESGKAWHGRNVGTGGRLTLQGEDKIPDLLPEEAGARLRSMWKRVSEKPGYFYALTRQNSHLVETLPSIRWMGNRILYAGPPASTLPQ